MSAPCWRWTARVLWGVLLVAAAGPAPAQRDFSEVNIRTTHVAGNVYLLEGEGGNIGASVGADGILIVDDQFAPLVPKIRQALSSIGGKGRLEFVLNTHWHGDHTGGNEAFGEEAPIVAHTNVRRRMSTRQQMRRGVIEPSPEGALPVVTFDESLSIHFNGEEILAIHYPRGHTDGDTVVFFTGSNVVHMGDDFWNGLFPFVDLDSGGTVEGLIDNVARILERLPPDAKVIPGHGELSDRDGLERFHRMLVETTAIVRRRIAEGKDLDAVKADGLPDEWDSWGRWFIDTDAWLATVYRSLTTD